MRAVLAVVVVVATAVTSAADELGRLPDPPLDEKDGGTAVMLSVLGTLGGVVAFRISPSAGIGALVLGPSVGRWYNHELGAGGAAVRLGAAALASSTLEWVDRECDEPDCYEQQRSQERRLYLCLGIMGVATIYDWAQSGLGAERYNEAQRRLHVAPTMVDRNTVGLGVAFQW
jgi:hypothetical protein